MKTTKPIKTKELFFDLPEELIALYPNSQRDQCRLILVNKKNSQTQEIPFYKLIEHLTQDDILVFNDTKVDRARIFGKRATGGIHEFVLLQASNDLMTWEAIANKTKRLKTGEQIDFTQNIQAEIKNIGEQGKITLMFQKPLSDQILNTIAELPLPPYIRNKRNYSDQDNNQYQTVFAKYQGSKAAPTAGLHFTEEMLSQLKEKGIQTAFIQLYVSLGTFEPIKTEWVDDFKIHREKYHISSQTANLLNQSLLAHKRIIAVGTTVARALESAYDPVLKKIQSGEQESSLFIKPGFPFRVVQGLITNFHTPGSTLLLLVAAYLGNLEILLQIYKQAIQEKIKFFSYGDAMFIF